MNVNLIPSICQLTQKYLLSSVILVQSFNVLPQTQVARECRRAVSRRAGIFWFLLSVLVSEDVKPHLSQSVSLVVADGALE